MDIDDLYTAAAESHDAGLHAYGDIQAEHNFETAAFGDSWPGAQCQLSDLRASLEDQQRFLDFLQPLLVNVYPFSFTRSIVSLTVTGKTPATSEIPF